MALPVAARPPDASGTSGASENVGGTAYAVAFLRRPPPANRMTLRFRAGRVVSCVPCDGRGCHRCDGKGRLLAFAARPLAEPRPGDGFAGRPRRLPRGWSG